MGLRHHSDPHQTIVLQEYFPQTQTCRRRENPVYRHALRYTEGAHLYRQKRTGTICWWPEGGTSYDMRWWCSERKISTGRPNCIRTRDADDQLASAGKSAAEKQPQFAAGDPHRRWYGPISPAVRSACPVCRCWLLRWARGILLGWGGETGIAYRLARRLAVGGRGKTRKAKRARAVKWLKSRVVADGALARRVQTADAQPGSKRCVFPSMTP